VEGDGTYNLKAKLDYDKDYNLPQLSLDISFKLVPCQEYSDYVAADFGTTNSCIAYLLIAPGRPIAPAPVKIDTLTRYEHMGVGFRSGSGFNPHLYSFCCFGVGRDLGGPLVGCIAEREAVGSYENAKRSIRSIKTKLGTEWSKSIDGVQFKAQEVAEFIIRELIQKALDEVKMRPVKAIITVPANSSPKKIEETLTMYEKAGLGPLTREENLIYEPEAAAYYYILKHQEFFENFPEGQPFYIMTFDFGGGTLDVSVVRVKKEGGKTYIKVLASRAKNIGGDTIDWALREKVIQRTQRIPSQGKKEEKKEWYTKRLSELTSELSSLKDEDRSRLMGNRLNLLVECEQAKIELAMGAQSYQIKQQVADDVTLFPKDLEDVLTGQDVIPTNPKSSIITEAKGLIDETIMLASNVVAKDEPNAEKISPETIDVLFIVGGTSRIPLIENKIKEKFLLIGGRTRVEPAIEEAKTCVALGAAFYAYSRRIRARYQFSKARPKTEYRIGILDESFKFQEIFPTGTPFDSKPSTPNTMTMPPGGECAFLFALNRGTQNFAIGNPEIEILGERIFADTNAGASFDVTYQLSDTGYISANVNYQGGSRILQVPILDKMPEGKPEDDPGF
jgi:molecular chaperone DnaK (HSP70)